MNLRHPNNRPLGRYTKILTYLGILALPISAGIASTTWMPQSTGAAESADAAMRPAFYAQAASLPRLPLPARIDDSSPTLAALRPEPDPAPRAELEPEPKPESVTKVIEVKRGDTLMQILASAGADRRTAHEAITALRDVFSPRELRPGQDIQLAFAPAEDGQETGSFLGLTLRPDADRDVRVSRGPENAFVAEEIERALFLRHSNAAGIIESSLSRAAQISQVPHGILRDAIHMFSFSVDFQREIQKGDSFELFYESFDDEDGNLAKNGDILYAAMTLSGSRLELYRYEKEDGTVDYYGPDGQSVRRTLMRTPIDGARLSSGFGVRKHPVLGYSKMHRGTDFAAPSGTPIYAAGDGVIERAGRNGSYGNYIRIRHNGTYRTAYAHLSKFAKGTGRGARVSQGQIIGYVGTTGRSTGPHLHYEVLVNNKQVNPLKIELPTGETLEGAELARFLTHREEIDRVRGETDGATQLVDAACRGSDEPGTQFDRTAC